MNKKDYKGYELIKAISDKEIKDKTKIEVHSLQDNIIAVIEYKNKRLEWGTGEFNTSYLFDKDYYFRILEDNTEEIEEVKEKNKSYDTAYNLGKTYSNKKWEDKIKAKIEEMDNIISQNEGIIFNGRYEHLHTLTEARIVKGEMQSLLEKE